MNGRATTLKWVGSAWGLAGLLSLPAAGSGTTGGTGADGATPPPPRASQAVSFLDVTEQAGIDFDGIVGDPFEGYDVLPSMMQVNMGNGAAVADYDGDGDLDVYLLGFEGHPNVLLRNDLDLGQKSFTDVTPPELADDGISRVAHFADLDNDGDLDLVLLNDHDASVLHSPSKIFRNDGGGAWSDVTEGRGFYPVGYLRCGAALADYDLDGRLDLYVTNWGLAQSPDPHDPDPMFPGKNQLFRNLGDFRFLDVTEAVGMPILTRDAFTPIFTDFDGDHRPDLFVAFDHTTDEFFWNRPEGFVQATQEVGTTHTGNDMGVACADLDDDGDLDLYATNITGPDFGTTQGNCYNENQFDTLGETRFENRAPDRGIEDTDWGWGVEFVDVENDGDLDIVAVTGFDEFIAFQRSEQHPLYSTPPTLFINDGQNQFERVSAPDLEYEDDQRALIAFDYDRDGDRDLLVTSVRAKVRLLENVSTPRGHWLDVLVEQAPGLNRQGIGVTVYATNDGVTKRREMLAGESYLAGTPTEVHFGLGDAESVETLRIEWTDGSETVLTDVPADQLITVRQPVAGDANGDRLVDFADLLVILGTWGDCPEPPAECPGDVTGDGTVNFEDILLALGNWS